jgi:hypothetical protein
VSLERIIVDDHVLLRVLLDDEPAELRPDGAEIFTTGLWYHRLCRSIGNRGVTEVLSRLIGSADVDVAAAVVTSIADLPDYVGLLSLRDLAWPMARLVEDGIRLNLLSLEALAAAEQVPASLCLALADLNSPLLDAAAVRGVTTRLI